MMQFLKSEGPRCCLHAQGAAWRNWGLISCYNTFKLAGSTLSLGAE